MNDRRCHVRSILELSINMIINIQIKKILDIVCYYVTPIALVFVSFFVRDPEILNIFGWVAVWLLVFLLFIKPLGLIYNVMWMKRWVGYRRQLGVATFWFAFFHSVMFIYTYKFYELFNYVGWNNYLFYGIVAMIGMMILAVTSNRYSLKRLRTGWKSVQHLVYPVFALTLIHVGMIRGEMVQFGIIIAMYASLKYLEFRKVRFFVKSA